MPVVGLGSLCDLSPFGSNQRQASFTVSEFAALDNGERVIPHNERGFGTISSTSDIWAHQTVEAIKHDVLTTVLPDDDDTDHEHPCEWLVELLRAQGIEATAADLRKVPYEVALTDRVLERLLIGKLVVTT